MSRLRHDAGPAAIIATDGSVRKVRRDHVASAYLTDRGGWWICEFVNAPMMPTGSLPLHAELRAIRAAVFHYPTAQVLTDSQNAVELVSAWKSGELLPVPHYAGTKLTTFSRWVAVHPDAVDVQWVRGHDRHPLNEGADSLARLGSRARRDGLTKDTLLERAQEIADAFAADFRAVAARGAA
jgi:ribonuclease HI